MKIDNLLISLQVIITYFEELLKEADTTELYESYRIALDTLNDIQSVLIFMDEYTFSLRKLLSMS